MSTPVLQKEQRIPRRERKPAPLTASRAELLSRGSDADFRTLVHSMLAFSTRLESVRAGFARLVGLTPIQYTMLISVSHLESDGAVSVNMLADHLQLSGAFVTIETGKLLRKGLLTKEPDSGDRRRVSLKTTPTARALLESLSPTQVAVNDVLFDFLDASGFRQLLKMARQMPSSANRALSLLHYLAEDKEPAR